MDEIAAHVFTGLWVAFTIPAVLLIGCAELGHRLGMRVHALGDKAGKNPIGGIQGAILALLGLLLGFTFSMAVSRYDLRRALVVKEANAIGTTFLRAELLPAAHVAPVEDLLRRYVALRLDVAPLADPAGLAAMLTQSAELQRQLWAHAVAAGKEAPNAMSSAFINALNETIDTEAERLEAARARIPAAVWMMLLVVAGLGCLTSSYSVGAEGTRSAFSSFVLPLLIAVVLTLIFDIMHPSRGFVGVSQQPFADLQRSIAPAQRDGS